MRHMILRLLSLATGTLLSAVSITAGSSILIDFETLPDGSLLPAGNEITNQFTSWGVTFDSIPPNDAFQITSISNALPTTSGNNCLAPGGPAPELGGTLILDFLIPVTEIGSFFIDDHLPIIVTAFDANLDPVMWKYSDSNPANFDSWSIAYPLGITRVTLKGGIIAKWYDNDGTLIRSEYDGWGIDDLSYTQIPEPATLLLLAVGGSCSSLFSRRRRFKGS